MSRNFKKISVASALVAATTLPTTMVSALETNVKNDSNTPVTLSSERRGWYEEYGYKYYYDDNGELLKGLQEIDGNTYYSSWYDEDTITDNGLIVTVNKSGIVTNYANIVVGDWTHYGDKWYYYDADMNPYIGVKTINGVEYYFNYGQLAEYLDKVVTSGDTLAYVRDGKVIEKIGSYDPMTEPSTIILDDEKLATWIKNGAKPTESVKELIERASKK